MRSKDPGFAGLWDEAFEAGKLELDRIALQRAFIGTKGRAIIVKGKVVGFERNFSDRLAEQQLKRMRPAEYSERLMVHGGIAHRHVHEHKISADLEALLRQAVDAKALINRPVIEGQAESAALDAAQPSSVIDRALALTRPTPADDKPTD